METIKVDESIYISGAPRGFSETGYRYNLNHPIINHLYTQYKKWRNLPEHMPMSDKERHSFERNIDKMIEDGKLVVRK